MPELKNWKIFLHIQSVTFQFFYTIYMYIWFFLRLVSIFNAIFNAIFTRYQRDFVILFYNSLFFDRIYRKSFQILKIYKISIIMNLYQNQKSYSSGFSFNQIDIHTFNIVAFISQSSQTANNNSPAASQNYSKPSQQFTACMWN